MKVRAINSKIIYKKVADEIILTENDFHPCKPFFLGSDLSPESIDVIKTRGILEVTEYIRETLAVFDFICQVGGEIHIEFFRGSFDNGGKYVRPLNFLLYELSLCFKDRYVLYKKEFANSIDFFYFKKIGRALPLDDEISKWTIGVLSNGSKNERILNLIDQLLKFNIPCLEILVCGPTPSTEPLPEQVRILDDSDLYLDKRIPISKKKNRIIENATYNNLVIIHDRISFSEDWYCKMLQYGNYFSQLCFPIYDEDSRSLRINDWQTFLFDNKNFRKSQARTLKYYEWDENIYVDGGILVIKKHIVENVKYNTHLNWNEMEDVDLSKRLFLYGSNINFYSRTYFLTETGRHKYHKIGFVRRVILRLFGSIQSYRENSVIRQKFFTFLNS